VGELPVTAPSEKRREDADDEPVLPDTTQDEHDAGWGDAPGSGRRDADWYERERPPHHE
jgi:hypothetical protein